MQFDEFEVNTDELNERLSSWRRGAGVAGQLPISIGEASINEAEVRIRQQRAISMLLHMLKGHDAFYAALKAHIEQEGGREGNHQQRILDMSAFALGAFEQFSAENIHNALRNELNNLPVEVIQTVTVPAPPPPRSWLQRTLGI